NDIQGTVAQSPIQMGRKVTEVIERMMKHQACKEEYLIPVHLVNKDNIGQYTITGRQ
ncbi:sugar ABC transporter substrate-binding protein, partial [Schaalia georgiae]